jgi:hypothetical protein
MKKVLNFNFTILCLCFLSCNTESAKKNSIEISSKNSEKNYDSLKENKSQSRENEKESVKNNPIQMEEIKKESVLIAEKEVEKKIINATLEDVFSKNPKQLDSYRIYLNTTPSKRNKETLLNGIKESIEEVKGLIEDIKTGKIKGVRVVPMSLDKLLVQLKMKEQELKAFKVLN